jgi:hypothetical protein
MPRQERLARQNGSGKLAARPGLEPRKRGVRFLRADLMASEANKHKTYVASERFSMGENFLTFSVLFRPSKRELAIKFRQ